MQYLLLIYGQESDWFNLTPAQTGAMMAEYGKFTEEITAHGKNLGSNRLKPVASATTVRVRDGKRVVTDGPFAETKEQVAGYWIWQVKSMEEAIAWLKRCPMTDGADVEIRPIFSPEDIGEAVSPEVQQQV